MECLATEAAILELVVALSHYTEEGNELFPQVIICDDLEIVLNLIQGSEPIQIGSGKKLADTAKQALKKCAPIAKKHWVIYIKRTDEKFVYGVFRGPFSPTALDIRDTILSLSQEPQDIKLILASQLSEKAVELIGACSGCLHFHLSALPEDSVAPRTNLESFIEIVCDGLDSANKEPVGSFLRSILTHSIRQCHGTLMAVISSELESLDDFADDGIILSEPINIEQLVDEYQKKRSDVSLGSLDAYSTLLSGMLSCDGIVLFNNKAQILGYNFFVQQDSSEKLRPRELLGGARRRAFETLCKKTIDNKLLGCFIQSSDSASQFVKEGKR